MKLKAIRDSYGSIPDLDALYTDRKHPNGLPYHIYVPDSLEAGAKYPVVIFLHGYTDIPLGMHNGFPKGVWSLPRVQSKHPHIVFIPRHRTIHDKWDDDKYRAMTVEALDDLIEEFNKNPKSPNMDTTRIYLTGFSRGGVGTWNFIKHYPNKFAAACPLAGFFEGPQDLSAAQAIRHVPIWIFNADGDGGVAGSRMSYRMLTEAQAPNVRYHEYKGHNHVIDDFAYFTEGFMDWLFAQKRTPH